MNHRSALLANDPDKTYRIKVRRRHIWEDALHQFKYKYSPPLHLHVTFLGEPAVDEGGPLREFFGLLLCEISHNNALLCGKVYSRLPTHNMIELSRKTYMHVGIMIAASIIHGGPAPKFFAPCIADYITFGLDHVTPTLEEIPDMSITSKLIKVINTSVYNYS